ncbi:Cytochrome 52A13 [Cyphellophora attinorum]|uniref:Cytochrome 52A13 n=1 Tax=Cyphellophora attinorum TaxID=1664694 RepID=A0A0N1NW11_9EURO|nr:Cytochrome 52A13 [Phialophora attinorum]KPI34486.1 Cytochrome 52A13 [Phialophora attinorum]
MVLKYFSYGSLIAVLFVGYTLSVLYEQYSKEKRIRKLGEVAPKCKTWAPWGLDFPFYSTAALQRNEAVEFWTYLFESTGGIAKLSYTCELRLLSSVRVIFTADPDNIKAILTTQFQDYGKTEPFHEEWKDFLGDSIFTTDGKQWSDSRNLIRPMFQRERVSDLELVEVHVQKLLKFLGPGDGRQLRLDTLFFRFTLDASTHFLYGESVNSLDNPDSEFATAFDEVQHVQVLEGRLGPFRHYYPKGGKRAALKKLDKFMDPIISNVLKLTPEEIETKLSKSDTFIHALARFTRDRKVMRDQIISLLLAGRDTTACTLSWLFLELSRNPKVVERLREEIHEHIGTDGRPPTYQEIKDMKYLTWVINETLRLYPVVPFNVRGALKDTTLPRGGGPDGKQPLGILKDTPIGYSTILMQRRRDLYPPISESFPYDPLDWVPERWATWTPKAWQYIPFNGGPRICIGMNFAMSEMGYTVVRLLQEFDTIIDYGNTTTAKCEIVITPADGTNVGFVKSAVKA